MINLPYVVFVKYISGTLLHGSANKEIQPKNWILIWIINLRTLVKPGGYIIRIDSLFVLIFGRTNFCAFNAFFFSRNKIQAIYSKVVCSYYGNKTGVCSKFQTDNTCDFYFKFKLKIWWHFRMRFDARGY